ncbi:protein Wiz [Lampris incognitus]|uniref:protein Wiz n=1 Tax=Lampris incognitus TaxID=2546036 RepID=UPI0024B5AAE4|nr:protein Wiz [Lampris incognitus]
MDSNLSAQPMMCELCGTFFETRQGLSSHARVHLRQLGVALSENTRSPIDVLYQIIQERDGSLPSLPKKTDQKGLRTSLEKGTLLKSSSSKAAGKATQKSAPQGSSSVFPSSSPPVRVAESRKSEGSSSTPSGFHQPTAKPFWAPQESDAPLTLASNSNHEDHVCQLCGSWFEKRKALSCHAQAHLRQIGVMENADAKECPIELLYKIMETEDLKPFSSEKQERFNVHTSPKSSTKRPSARSPSPMFKGSPSSLPLQSAPRKRAKASDEFTCVLCGEMFENRKGLASHSRSHLRQVGVIDLLGKGSAIDAVQKLVSSGMQAALKPCKKNTTTASSPAPSPATPPASSSVPGPTPPLSTSLSPPPSQSLSSTQGRPSHSPLTSANRAPKAKKGFRLAVDPLKRKPKPESIQGEMSVLPQGLITSSNSTTQMLSSPVVKPESIKAGTSAVIESIPSVPCDFCGQLFDTRKALSCHARAHLRYLGISWLANTSPVDVLREAMQQGQGLKDSVSSGSSVSGGTLWAKQGPKRSLDSLMSGDPATKACIPPFGFSPKEKPSPGKTGIAQAVDTTCELCGFDFDNRKALASHARAHLRQLGVTEWKADGAKGSPIEILREWIQKEPAKVAEITRRYRIGDLYIKKRHVPTSSLALDSGNAPGGSLKPLGLQGGQKVEKEKLEVASRSSSTTQVQSHKWRGYMQTQGTRSDFSAHSSRGFRPSKHPVHTQERNQDINSQQPSRSGNIPALLPKPPPTPLVKFVGKIYSLKCRFCEKEFHGPLSIQVDWIAHLQKHILTLGYKGKASPPPAPVATSALL